MRQLSWHLNEVYYARANQYQSKPGFSFSKCCVYMLADLKKKQGLHRWPMTLSHLPYGRMSLLRIRGLPNNHCAHTASWGGGSECVQLAAWMSFLNLKANTNYGRFLKIIRIRAAAQSTFGQAWILAFYNKLSEQRKNSDKFLEKNTMVSMLISKLMENMVYVQEFFFPLKGQFLKKNKDKKKKSHIWNMDTNAGSFCCLLSSQYIFRLASSQLLFNRHYRRLLFLNRTEMKACVHSIQ